MPLLKIIKLKSKKLLNIAFYYPSNFELNVLKFLEFNNILSQNILLPVIDKNDLMNFFLEKNDVLFVNQYGILEPLKSKANSDVILVPVLAFDKNKYRLGYGKGFMIVILINT